MAADTVEQGEREQRDRHCKDSAPRTNTDGAEGRAPVLDTGPLDRRRFLVAAATPAVAALAGCPGTVSRTFSARPVVLPGSVQSRREYVESSVESITTERSGSVAGVDFEATIESYLSAYRYDGETGGSGVRRPGVGVFASPNAAVQGNSINPLATASLQSVLAGDDVPEARTEILERLGGIEGPEWISGPAPVDTAEVTGGSSGPSAEFLGDSVDIEPFGGLVRDGEGAPYAVLVFMARRIDDDVAIFASVLDRPLEEGASTDRAVVGEDAYFTQDHLAGGLSVVVDLLPLFRVQGGPSTPTPTATPTPTPTPTGSGGTGTVIDNFEDGDLTEYRQLGIVNSSFVNSPTSSGSKALKFTNMYASYGVESTSGLPNYPHQGDQFRANFRFQTSPQAGLGFQLLFGTDAQGGNYLASATKTSSGDWEVKLHDNGSTNAGSFRASLSAQTWYAFDVSWGPQDIELQLIELPSGRVHGSTTVPANGDNGDDYIAFKAYPRQHEFLWDYAHLGSSARSGPNTSFPLVIDDFEDGNTSEYRQMGSVTSSFVNSPTKHGSNALKFTTVPQNSVNGYVSTGGLPHYPHLGDQFRAWFHLKNTFDPGQTVELYFGEDASGNIHTVRATKQQSGTDWKVALFGASGNGRFTATIAKDNWYAFDVTWGHTDIDLTLLDSSGSSLGSTTVSSTGDNGNDYIGFRASSGQHTLLWDYAHVVGWARNP